MIESPKTRASRDCGEPVVWEDVEERSIWQPPYETPHAFLAETIRQSVGKRRASLPFGPAESRNSVGEVHGKTGIVGIRENAIVPILGRRGGDPYFFRLCPAFRQKRTPPPRRS